MVQAPLNQPQQSQSISSRLPGSYDDLYRQAQEKVNAQQYDEALSIFQRIYTRLGKLAEKNLTRRPELKQLYTLSIAMSADLLGLQRSYEEAISHYHWLADVSPEQAPQAKRAVAQIKIDQGQVEEGLDSLRAVAVANSNEAWPWLSLGLELLGQEQYEEAEISLKRVTDREDIPAESRFEAYNYLFDLYRDQERYDEAEQAWLTGWQVSGQKMNDVTPLYQMFWGADNLPKAYQWLEKEENPLRQGFYRGLFAQAEGDESKALNHWKRIASKKPLEFSEGHESWAEAALRTDAPLAQVGQTLAFLASRNQINIRGLVLLAIAEIKTDHVSEAKETLETALDMLKRMRPPQEKFTDEHWDLFEALILDEDKRAEFASYFDLSESA